MPEIHWVAHALGVALDVAQKPCPLHPWCPISAIQRNLAASVLFDVAPDLLQADKTTLVQAAALLEANKTHRFCLACRRNVVRWSPLFIHDSARELGAAHQEPHEVSGVLELRVATLEARRMPPRRTEELLDDTPERWYCQDVFTPRHECCSRRRTAHRPLGSHGVEGWLIAARRGGGALNSSVAPHPWQPIWICACCLHLRVSAFALKSHTFVVWLVAAT